MSQQADPQQRELLRVCRIGRAQGLKGEVTVRSFTDEPELRFAAGSVLYTKDGSHTYTVAHSRTFKDRWILHFKGVDNRDASEALNGLELYVEADDPEEMAEEDAWYPKDLIGLEARVYDNPANGIDAAKSGQVIGKVVDVIDGPAQSLLKIRLATPVIEHKDGSFTPLPVTTATNGQDTGNEKVIKTVLVPFVDELVPDINLDSNYLTLDPPTGLIPEW
ncbi:ribosome maturation factor RimM [Bifidobacterium sp. ESL0732]|uniref:ribosome maturation factor RimM n=1 Tax=Bifidobacterium sp. ESL0732 TaxID=2983222 RepID=UPI0023F74BF3|nr:ribosome maturation factor RimM [Bifidobacterium sp. ESL0732]WEV64963.1 ribosome maturation factor RimM [Bifidobacterium sp. ESL0732]